MNTVLAFKAELVLAFQLIARHRAPRFAMLLAFSAIALLMVQGGPAPSPALRHRTIVLTGGIVAAVAASRLLAHGGPYTSARRTALRWLPLARLVSAVAFAALPGILSATAMFTTGWSASDALRLLLVLGLCSGAVGAVVMMLTPLWGASLAASAGVLMSVGGAIPPSRILEWLRDTPALRAVVHPTWSILPLPWRALDWLESGGRSGLLILGLWMIAGVTVCGLLVSASLPRPRSP